MGKAGNSSSSARGKGCSNSSMTATEKTCSSIASRIVGSSSSGRGADCVHTVLMCSMLDLALQSKCCLRNWEISRSNAEAEPSPASSAGAAVEDHDGAEAGRRDASAATSAAAGGSAASAPITSGGELRLAKMPAHGLPAAVVAQYDRLATKWPEAMFLENGKPAHELHPSLWNETELLQPLLEDLLELLQVLMLEVPLPIGCSNPRCTSLQGGSEAAAMKMCSDCKVVGYCDRACQVAHWKAHKGVCARLQQLGEGHEQGKKG